MKYILMFVLMSLAVAEETDLSKRGIAKTPTINSLSNNGHQKPEQLSYSNYKQTNPSTQSPIYPLQTSSYTSESQNVQQQQHQPQQLQQSHQTYNFLPQQHQLVPVSVVPQPLAVPKYQLVAMKGSNGQMHLTLIPQNLFLSPQHYAAPAVLPLSQPVLNNHLSQSQTTQTNYVTPQPVNHNVQSASAPLTLQSAFYQPQHGGYSFGHNPFVGQPSTMFLYSQPAPQVYHSASNSHQAYSPVQQLVNYYQANPLAKHQLLYGNSQNYHQGHVTSYQSPLSVTDYEKSASSPVVSSITAPKNENDLALNTNEFVQQDEQFRPIPSYGARGLTNYKN